MIKRKTSIHSWVPNIITILCMAALVLIILRNERESGEKLREVYHDKAMCNVKLDHCKENLQTCSDRVDSLIKGGNFTIGYYYVNDSGDWKKVTAIGEWKS
jgi:hypothetical protein